MREREAEQHPVGRGAVQALQGPAARLGAAFFATEFFAPSFAATKKQILRRLWGVLSTPAFERMFMQRDNKFDLYAAMIEGKIILASTAKDRLKSDGSALLGRFFIAMIAQAALERSVIAAEERTPAFLLYLERQPTSSAEAFERLHDRCISPSAPGGPSTGAGKGTSGTTQRPDDPVSPQNALPAKVARYEAFWCASVL